MTTTLHFYFCMLLLFKPNETMIDNHLPFDSQFAFWN